MSMFNFLRGKGTVRTPLTPDEAREQGARMLYRKEWSCSCGATLRIRSKDSRRDGESNLVRFPKGHPLEGHSQIPSNQLNWNGLVEERGWDPVGVRCPACIRGMTVKEFKEAKRAGKLSL